MQLRRRLNYALLARLKCSVASCDIEKSVFANFVWGNLLWKKSNNTLLYINTFQFQSITGTEHVSSVCFVCFLSSFLFRLPHCFDLSSRLLRNFVTIFYFAFSSIFVVVISKLIILMVAHTHYMHVSEEANNDGVDTSSSQQLATSTRTYFYIFKRG